MLIVGVIGGAVVKWSRVKNSKLGRYVSKGGAPGVRISGFKKRTRAGGTRTYGADPLSDNGPVTPEKISESIRYLNEDAFRPRTKK